SVGPKTAATLLNDYGDLDGVFKNLDKISRKKLKETLTNHEADARLSRQLVALKDDCEVDISAENLAFSPSSRRDEAQLSALFTELGFTRQLTALKNGTSAIQQDDNADSHGTGSADAN